MGGQALPPPHHLLGPGEFTPAASPGNGSFHLLFSATSPCLTAGKEGKPQALTRFGKEAPDLRTGGWDKHRGQENFRPGPKTRQRGCRWKARLLGTYLELLRRGKGPTRSHEATALINPKTRPPPGSLALASLLPRLPPSAVSEPCPPRGMEPGLDPTLSCSTHSNTGK